MRLFAIGDLHLPGRQDKPMNVFGTQWDDHPRRIQEAWSSVITAEDWVLVPGDISWAMHLTEVEEDMQYLRSLPGKIIMVRGNHDYWWQSIGKVRSVLPENVIALQNDYVQLPDGTVICGTRGWELPGREGVTAHDVKIYQRELIRLELSLQAAEKSGAKRIVAMFHFPPADSSGASTGFTDLLEKYGVELCVYGHLHGPGIRNAVRGRHRGVTYHLVSCDSLGFRPLLLAVQ